MDMMLENLCKQLRVSGLYAYVQEYLPDNPALEQLLILALQAEIDKRRLNRQMKSLDKLDFPQRSGSRIS